MTKQSKLIIAVDPGLSTGLAWWGGENLRPSTSCIKDWFMVADFISEKIQNTNVPITLVIEKFTITTKTGKLSQQPEALKLTGVLEYMANSWSQVNVVFQTPSAAKNFSKDTKLKHLGWWAPTDHERDALRHLVLYSVKNGYLDASVFGGM